MNVRTLKATALAGSILLVVGCAGSGGSGDAAKGAAASGPSNDPAIRAAIDSMNAQFSVAFKAGDATKAASFYADDATSMPPNSEPENGRAAIEKGYVDLFKALGKVDDFTAQSKDFAAYSDHVIDIGSYAFSFTPPGAKEAVKDHGSFINYWRKQADGSWKIYRDAIVSANPLPAPPTPSAAKK